MKTIAKSFQELAPALRDSKRKSPDERRRKARDTKGRLVFDCYNAKVFVGRIHCKHAIFKAGGKSGTLLERSVLQGLKPKECQECVYYNDGEKDGDADGD